MYKVIAPVFVMLMLALVGCDSAMQGSDENSANPRNTVPESTPADPGNNPNNPGSTQP